MLKSGYFIRSGFLIAANQTAGVAVSGARLSLRTLCQLAGFTHGQHIANSVIKYAGGC